MSNLIKELTAAHLNGLKSSIHALEIQTTILKTLLKSPGKKSAASDDDEDREALNADGDTDEDEDDKPAKKTRGKSKKNSVADESDEEEEDSDSDEDTEDSESDEDDSDTEDEEDEDEKPAKKINKGAVIKALAAYAEENTRAKALKHLKSFGVKSVHDLDPKKYAALLKKLG